MGRLCTGGSSEIGPKGRVSDDRERSKCSMVTGSAWGIMATYFWGLLGVNGCIQVFNGDRWCMGDHGYIFLGTPWS
jgi:hypothetical protein